MLLQSLVSIVLACCRNFCRASQVTPFLPTITERAVLQPRDGGALIGYRTSSGKGTIHLRFEQPAIPPIMALVLILPRDYFLGVNLGQLTALLHPGLAVSFLAPLVRSQLHAVQTIKALLCSRVSLTDHFYGNPVLVYY